MSPSPPARGAPARFLPAAGAVCLAAISACLFFLWAYPVPEVVSDARGYLEIAQKVAAGAGFTQDGVTPMVYRPPLFSTLLGGWFFLTGTGSPLSAAVFQSVLHGAAVLVAFLLFLEATSPAWAFAGAAWVALNPLLVTRVAFVLQEPTILLFTTLAAWLSVRFLRNPTRGRAALVGAAWGLCTLAKVVAWFAPFLLLAMRFLPGRLRKTLRGVDAALLLLCFAAVISPWTIRNYIHFNRFIPVNAQGEGMLEWNVSQAEIPGEPPGAEFTAEVYRKELSENGRKRLLWGYVLDHPGYFFFLRTLRNAIYFGAPARDWWDARGLMHPGEHRAEFWILSLLFHVPLYVLLLLRTWEWWRGSAFPAYGFLVLLYWAYWAEHAVLWGDPRFGIAVYPLLIAIALPAGPKGNGKVSAESTPAPA